MKIQLASTAELYREHRRTQSVKKKAKIAAELQRRHDETYGYKSGPYWCFPLRTEHVCDYTGAYCFTKVYRENATRYNFGLCL